MIIFLFGSTNFFRVFVFRERNILTQNLGLKKMRKWANFCEIFAKILQEFLQNQKVSNKCGSNVSIQLSLGLNFRFLVFAKVFVFSQKMAKTFATIFAKFLFKKCQK